MVFELSATIQVAPHSRTSVYAEPYIADVYIGLTESSIGRLVPNAELRGIRSQIDTTSLSAN
jgi:hypothetical protein